MRNAILGTIAGLAFGTVGALAYSHYLGDGKLVADLQSQLDAANASVKKTTTDAKQLTSETSGVSDQINRLLATNDELKKELEDAKKKEATPAVAAPEVNLATLGGMMMGMMRGGGLQGQQRLFLLQSRLHLTPDQMTALKAAMEADARTRRDIGRQMFQGGKVDPQTAANANTFEKTLTSTLTPTQALAYQQVQADERTARADTAATIQVNQISPLLQLSDQQKEQVFNALYQVQATAPEPASLLTNPNAPAAIVGQAQATQAALAKVLTPDQMTLYQQQAQALAAEGTGRRGRGGNGNGGGGGAGGDAATPAGTPTTANGAAPATTAATPAARTTDTGTTNAPSSTAPTTNAPSSTGATTNAPTGTTTNTATPYGA